MISILASETGEAEAKQRMFGFTTFQQYVYQPCKNKHRMLM